MKKDIIIKIENASFSWGNEIKDNVDDSKNKKNKNSNNKVAPIEEKSKQKEKRKDSLDKKIFTEEKRNLLNEEEIKNTDSEENDLSKSKEIKDSNDTTLFIKDNNNINKNTTLTIENDSKKKEDFELKKTLKNINFEVKKGELIAIIGEVGAGKSSLLQAILNNLIIIDEDENQSSNNHGYVNNNDIHLSSEIINNNKKQKVIINGSLSYVSQISWIENETLKNNILFNQPFDKEKYNRVLEISELKPDLEMLVGGDMTEIGEKGINLSGGQKARVSIARSIYTEKDIYIFDDPISALDAHVGERIMKNCILGYLKEKTRILVTHALQYLKFVDRIIILKEGKIIWEGKYDQLINESFYSEFSMKINNKKSEEAINNPHSTSNDENENGDSKSNQKNLIEEKIDEVIKSRKQSIKEKSNEEDNEKNKSEIDEIISENEIILKNYNKNEANLKNIKSLNQNIDIENDHKANKITEEKQTDFKKSEIKRITVDEDKEVGSVKWSVYFSYVKMMGGYFVFIILILIIMSWQSLRLFSDIYLTNWTKKQDQENNFLFYSKYSAISLSTCFLVIAVMCIVLKGSLKTSRALHKDMLLRLVRAPINIFHDTIPKGQILNRISKDLGAIDSYTCYMYREIIVYLFSFLGAIAMCSYMNIWCLIFLPFILIVGLSISRYYMNCSRDLSRLDGIVRSPIINLLSATIPGATTIRAFKFEDIYKNKFYEKVDEFYKIRLFVNGAQNWFGMSIDILSITFLGFLIFFLIEFKDKFSSQQTGLMLTYYIVLQDTIFSFLSYTAWFENSMVSLERCLKYFEIPQEKPNILETDESLIQKWPNQGKIEFKNFSVKYRPDNEIVLKNLNFTINPREKIGVVGRTGSGKSTLCLCLFRILEPLMGSIIIDEVDITEIGLKLLRNSITIIPQVNLNF